MPTNQMQMFEVLYVQRFFFSFRKKKMGMRLCMFAFVAAHIALFELNVIRCFFFSVFICLFVQLPAFGRCCHRIEGILKGNTKVNEDRRATTNERTIVQTIEGTKMRMSSGISFGKRPLKTTQQHTRYYSLGYAIHDLITH